MKTGMAQARVQSTFEVEGGRMAARRARELARSALRGELDAANVEKAVLLVSELVGNSVVHGGADAGSAVGLVVSRGATTIRIEILDDGPGFAWRPTGDDPTAGWGFFLVGKLADRWGFGDGPRTSVWFELEVS